MSSKLWLEIKKISVYLKYVEIGLHGVMFNLCLGPKRFQMTENDALCIYTRMTSSQKEVLGIHCPVRSECVISDGMSLSLMVLSVYELNMIHGELLQHWSEGQPVRSVKRIRQEWELPAHSQNMTDHSTGWNTGIASFIILSSSMVSHTGQERCLVCVSSNKITWTATWT